MHSCSLRAQISYSMFATFAGFELMVCNVQFALWFGQNQENCIPFLFRGTLFYSNLDYKK